VLVFASLSRGDGLLAADTHTKSLKKIASKRIFKRSTLQEARDTNKKEVGREHIAIHS